MQPRIKIPRSKGVSTTTQVRWIAFPYYAEEEPLKALDHLLRSEAQNQNSVDDKYFLRLASDCYDHPRLSAFLRLGNPRKRDEETQATVAVVNAKTQSPHMSTTERHANNALESDTVETSTHVPVPYLQVEHPILIERKDFSANIDPNLGQPTRWFFCRVPAEDKEAAWKDLTTHPENFRKYPLRLPSDICKYNELEEFFGVDDPQRLDAQTQASAVMVDGESQTDFALNSQDATTHHIATVAAKGTASDPIDLVSAPIAMPTVSRGSRRKQSKLSRMNSPGKDFPIVDLTNDSDQEDADRARAIQEEADLARAIKLSLEDEVKVKTMAKKEIKKEIKTEIKKEIKEEPMDADEKDDTTQRDNEIQTPRDGNSAGIPVLRTETDAEKDATEDMEEEEEEDEEEEEGEGDGEESENDADDDEEENPSHEEEIASDDEDKASDKEDNGSGEEEEEESDVDEDTQRARAMSMEEADLNKAIAMSLEGMNDTDVRRNVAPQTATGEMAGNGDNATAEEEKENEGAREDDLDLMNVSAMSNNGNGGNLQERVDGDLAAAMRGRNRERDERDEPPEKKAKEEKTPVRAGTSVQPKDEVKKEKNELEMLTCTQCSKELQNLYYGLRLHAMHHSEQLRFHCTRCPKKEPIHDVCKSRVLIRHTTKKIFDHGDPMDRKNDLLTAYWDHWTKKCFPNAQIPNRRQSIRNTRCKECENDNDIPAEDLGLFTHIVSDHYDEELDFDDPRGVMRRFFPGNMPPKRPRPRASAYEADLNRSSTTEWLLDYINLVLKERETRSGSVGNETKSTETVSKRARKEISSQSMAGAIQEEKTRRELDESGDNEIDIISAVAVSKLKRTRKEVPSHLIPAEKQSETSLTDILMSSGFSMNETSNIANGMANVLDGPVNKKFKAEMKDTQVAKPSVTVAGEEKEEVDRVDTEKIKTPKSAMYPHVSCEVCNSRCASMRFTLNMHAMTHCKEKRYMCNQCEHAGARCDEVVKHMERKHGCPHEEPIDLRNELRDALWNQRFAQCFPLFVKAKVRNTIGGSQRCTGCSEIVHGDFFDHIISSHAEEDLDYDDPEGVRNRFFPDQKDDTIPSVGDGNNNEEVVKKGDLELSGEATSSVQKTKDILYSVFNTAMTFKCVVCETILAKGPSGWSATLTAHAIGHYKEKRFECVKGDFRADTVAMVNDHMQRSHGISNVIGFRIDRNNGLRKAKWKMWTHRCFPEFAKLVTPQRPKSTTIVSCVRCQKGVVSDESYLFDHIFLEHSDRRLNYNDQRIILKFFPDAKLGTPVV